MEPRTEGDVSVVRIGHGEGGSLGAFHSECGERAIGSERDPRELWRGARLSTISSGNDDGSVVVCQRRGNLLVASDSASLSGTRGFHGADGNAEAGLSDDQSVSTAASGSAEGAVQTSVEALQKGGDGEVGPRRLGWQQDPRQCEFA